MRKNRVHGPIDFVIGLELDHSRAQGGLILNLVDADVPDLGRGEPWRGQGDPQRLSRLQSRLFRESDRSASNSPSFLGDASLLSRPGGAEIALPEQHELVVASGGEVVPSVGEIDRVNRSGVAVEAEKGFTLPQIPNLNFRVGRNRAHVEA